MHIMHIWQLTMIPLLLILLILVIRNRSTISKSVPAPKPRPYHAIKVHPCKNACDCAKRVDGQRILSSDFEAMKAIECDRAYCNCTYEHFNDRRSGIDRRNFAVHLNPIWAEKRSQPYGRRLTDIHNKARRNSVPLGVAS